MKTKIKLLVIVGLLFCAANSVVAQVFFYDRSRAISVGGRDGVFLQADVAESGLVTLYNRANQLTYTGQTVDGRPRRFDERIRDVEPDNWTRDLAMRIVREAFSAEEISRIRQGESFGIAMIISPETGRVIEVNFDFFYRSSYATIPVATFRRIELALIEQIRFTPTADGRRMNYIIRFWSQELVPSPSRRSPDNRPPPPPPRQPPPSGGSAGGNVGGPGDTPGGNDPSGGNNNRPTETDIFGR